jgi:HSP20 family molecular chaperone IbpA
MYQTFMDDPFFKEFRIFFKDNFKTSTDFVPFVQQTKTGYPVDSYLTDEFLVFEIPIIQGSVDDIELIKTGNQLKIKYKRPKSEVGANVRYITKQIVRRDFELNWEIDPKFDGSKISSTYENGLLSIFIPFMPTSKPEKIGIVAVDNNWKKVANGEEL